MFKEFLAGTLTPEDWGNFLQSLDKIEPEIPYRGSTIISFVHSTGTFYLSDRHGFLCGVKSLDNLLTLLAIDREQGIRAFLKIPYDGQRYADEPFQVVGSQTGRWSSGENPPPREAPHVPLTAMQVRARDLANQMQERRFGTPISGDTADVVPLIDKSENDPGFSAQQAEDYLNLSDKED